MGLYFLWNLIFRTQNIDLRMSRRFLDAQTQLIDHLLAELLQLPNADHINFNNTKQFDILLRHLELTLVVRPITLVPSTYVLHVLFTLAARCPSSNWTHDTSISESIGTPTEYMKQVNSDYDATLYKEPLGARSLSILRRYVEILSQETSPAVEILKARLEQVVASMLVVDSFFGKPTPTEDSGPGKEQGAEQTEEYDAAVEVISDSEGLSSDSLLDAQNPIELISRYKRSLPKTVTSLSDIGARTSGLGEAATLFKDMPHLLAHATPEPEDSKAKRAKNTDPLRVIQVFDDSLLARKFADPGSYSVWSLLKWTFHCAETSSQYQQFLFNSFQTNVHSVYEAYSGVFKVIFLLMTLQYVENRPSSKKNLLLVDRLLLIFGTNDWYDRAAGCILTGVTLSSNDKPYPCYNRERTLIRNDPLVQNSQCKTTVNCDDNMSSMGLRMQIIALLYAHEQNKIHQQNKIHELKIREKTLKASFLDSVCWIIWQWPLRYLNGFFSVKSTEVFLCPEEDLNYVMVRLCSRLLSDATGLLVQFTDLASRDEIIRLADLIGSDELYESIANDTTYESFDAFFEKWQKVIFFAEWLLAFVPAKVADEVLLLTLREKALAAEKKMDETFSEYMHERSEDADLLAEDVNFTMSELEIRQCKAKLQRRFTALVRCKLAVSIE